MTQTETLFGLEDFARGYIQGINHHSQVRTEHLADAFRSYFGLPDFPTLSDLNALCPRLGVTMLRLPDWAPMEGVNIWPLGQRPAIHLRPDLNRKRTNTTMGHELRELIETAFKRTAPAYVGLDIADNRMMHRESEHFASCLLMPAGASRTLLEEVGFDLRRFSARTQRSLASIVVRLQSLFSVGTGLKEPHCGVWLFEAPWEAVANGTATASMMTARYEAKLCGFSLSKSKGAATVGRRPWFPSHNCSLITYGPGLIAVEDREPILENLTGLDLFGDHNFTVVCEPFFRDGVPSKVLVTAVRNDCLPSIERWLGRLAIRTTFTVGAS